MLSSLRSVLHSSFLVGFPSVVLAQAPSITAVLPVANALAVPHNSPVTVTFDQSLLPTSGSALQLYSAQHGGLLTQGSTPTLVRGNTLTFTPLVSGFQPGETIMSTVTTAAAGTGGSLPTARVFQFTVAVRGAGQGVFERINTPTVGSVPYGVAVGDIDGDGDLDILTANAGTNNTPGRTVSVRLNDGQGQFSGTQNVSVGFNPQEVVLGDVDGDGDLDFVVANHGNVTTASSTVSVRLNDGQGLFNGTQEVEVGPNPNGVVLGDVDGDGDLDLLASNELGGRVSIRLNDGTGNFTGAASQYVLTGSFPQDVVLADVDKDGDLDLLTANTASSSVSVRRNDGRGTFSGMQEVPVRLGPTRLAVGDIDGDGDVDFATTDFVSGVVSVRFNDGTGTFNGTQSFSLESSPRGVALGDVDGDGDLDLVTANASYPISISIRLNNGVGTFSGTQNVPFSGSPEKIVLGDIDGDGDLDIIVAPASGITVSVFRNRNANPLAVRSSMAGPAFQVAPNPTHGTVLITGLPPRQLVQVLDVVGSEVVRSVGAASGPTVLRLPAGVAAGLYLVRSGSHTVRLMLE